MRHDRPAFSYRDDPRIPAFDDAGPVAVMDATCGLCAKGAAWIARNDAAEVFRIVPVQSDLGAALLQHYGMDPEDPLTWLVLDQGAAFGSLDATIHVGRRLGGLWHVLTLLRVLPRRWRDVLYGVVARNRYKIMGRADLCNLPNPQIQKRLLLISTGTTAAPSTQSATPPSSN